MCPDNDAVPADDTAEDCNNIRPQKNRPHSTSRACNSPKVAMVEEQKRSNDLLQHFNLAYKERTKLLESLQSKGQLRL